MRHLTLLLLSLALLSVARAQTAKAADYPACGKSGLSQLCKLQPVWSEQEVRSRLAGKEAVWWAHGDVFTVLARRPGDNVELCCAIQAPMARVSRTDLWALSLRVPELERAILDVGFMPWEQGRFRLEEWRGPRAPLPPPLAKEPAGEISQLEIESTALGERRKLTVYTPPQTKPSSPLPVIYVADGRSVAVYGRIVDALIARGEVRPLVLVGLWTGPAGGPEATASSVRAFEYLEGFKGGAERYQKHQRYLLDEVLPLARTRFNASSRREEQFLSGSSNGAVWAFEAARAYPDVFGGAIVMSAGWQPPSEYASLKHSRLFLGAGTLEDEFFDDTQARAEGARKAGAEVTFQPMISGHSPSMWQVLFADAVVNLLGTDAKS